MMYKQEPEQDQFPVATGEVSVSRIWGASQENTQALTESWMHSEARKTASKIGKKLTAEEANERFPGLGADRDISEGEAQYLHDWKKERADRQKIIDSASDSFLKGTVLPFVAGAVDSLTDPAEVAIGLLTGGIGNGLAKGATLGRKLAIDTVEAMAGQAIAEAPIMYESNQSFEKYTSKQFAQNVVLAGAMQVGLTHGASAAYRGTAKALSFAGEKTSENLYRLAKKLEESGVSSTESMNKAINKIKDSFEKVDTLRTTVESHFPDLDIKGDNFEEVMGVVVKKFDEGEITEEAMNQFAKDAFENGVDPEMMAKVVDDSAYVFPDDIVEEIKRTNMEPSSQRGFDDRYYDQLDEMEKNPIDSIDQQISNSYRESIDNLSEDMLEETIDIGNGKQIKLKDLDAEVKDRQLQRQFLQEYGACLKGA